MATSAILKPRVVLPGGTGFLGQAFGCFMRDRGWDVVILSRGKSGERDGLRYVQWDGRTQGAWSSEIDGSEAVVNFAGKSVNCLYTPENRKEIVDSRLHSVQAVAEAVRNASQPPRVIVQSASLAIFGDNTTLCDEQSPVGEGFSVEVCKAWEEAFFAGELPHSRRVLLRVGFALGKNGGALEPLTRLVKWFMGGTVGSGKQYISWIHLDDLNRMFLWCIEREVSGMYNATGPAPVTNRVFMRSLRRALHRPWSPPAPAFMVRLGARYLMRTEADLALTGRNCVPKRFEQEGFTFLHTDLDETLRSLV